MELKSAFDLAQVAAFNNVVTSVNVAAEFPSQVFLGSWEKILFFESDHVFAPQFANIIQGLVTIERAKSCCLLNITQTTDFLLEKAATMFLEPPFLNQEYYLRLRSGGASEGWLFRMDRYACSSDRGEWSVYCEKGNDIAAIALRGSSGEDRFSEPIKQLTAKSIVSLVKQGSDAPVPFNRLTKSWESALLKNYS